MSKMILLSHEAHNYSSGTLLSDLFPAQAQELFDKLHQQEHSSSLLLPCKYTYQSLIFLKSKND